MPAAIAAQCPECGKGLKVPAAAAGKRVKCPQCGAAVKVPAGSGAAPAAGKAGAKRKAKAPAGPAAHGNSGEIFAGLDLDDYGATSGRQSALPGRVNRGPSSSEIPIPAFEGPGKKPEKPPTPLPVVLGVIGGSLLLLALAGGGAAYVLLNSGPIEAPANLVRFSHPEPRTFALDVPEGWEQKSGGGTGGRPAFASFEGPGGEVDVRMSLRGSAMGDIGNAVQGDSFVVGAEVPEELTAIYGQHEATKQQVADDYSDYKETGGHNFNPRGGEGRMSTFTASGSFGGGITGLRGTVRIGTDTYIVLMKCAPKDFGVMKPVFEKMMQSLGR